MTADMGETDSCETDNSMAFSRKCLYDGTLKESYLKIVEFNPVWMILQPSIAVMLCNIIQEYNLEIPPALRYIEFTGEYLVDGVRQKAKDVFRCTVANQYSPKEVNSIAFECPEEICNNILILEKGRNYREYFFGVAAGGKNRKVS